MTRLIAKLVVMIAASSLFIPLARADDPPGKPARLKPAEVLEKAWPDHPEWVAMLVDILQGSQLGPGEGWFKKAAARTR